MTSAKDKIRTCVDEYMRLFPEEFALFKDWMATRRSSLIDEEFGQVQGSGNEMRAVVEMPEVLHAMIAQRLDTDELTWFKSGTDTNRNAGSRWFMGAFPVFALSKI